LARIRKPSPKRTLPYWLSLPMLLAVTEDKNVVYAACVLIVAAMIAASITATVKFPAASRLPMQWGVNGKPTWYASRKLAFAFTPVLATLVVTFVLLMAEPASAAAVLIAVAFFAGHLLHLWLVYRDIRKG
jgi:succinate-acetate transporter protein